MATKLWRSAMPLAAIAALGLTACTHSQEPSDVKGTTPPVWTEQSGAKPTDSHGAGSDSHGAGGHELKGELKDASGRSVGTVSVSESGGHVQIKVSARGLTPGFHGFHVHQTGKCEGDFASAGGHFQKGAPDVHPATGDLTSLQVRKDGSAELVTTADAFTLEDIENHGEGRAFVVHAAADNFGNIPNRYAPAPDQQTLSTGDAGGRVACAVVK